MASASTLSEETLHAYAMRMLAEQKAKAEPMPLPALDPFPPDPQPVEPPKRKADPPPAPPPVMVAMRTPPASCGMFAPGSGCTRSILVGGDGIAEGEAHGQVSPPDP